MTLAAILTHVMALIAGACVGVLTSALCKAARRRDAEPEERDLS